MTDKPLILVADDETRIRRLVVESLENAGFDVCQAQDGRQAVDVFRLSPVEPDLVILDLMMPEMDGHSEDECSAGPYSDGQRFSL